MAETFLPRTHEHKPLVAPRHERKDANIFWIVATAGMLTATILLVFLVSWWVFKALRLSEPEPVKTSSMPMSLAGRQFPPEPRLEGLVNFNQTDASNPGLHDYRRLRAAQQQQLNSYGWVNQQKGIVHIPIEAAMKIIVDNILLPEETVPKADAAEPNLRMPP
jgi:hypothetical protein